jgi:hypothetical protein
MDAITTISKEGQEFVDEPVYVRPKDLVSQAELMHAVEAKAPEDIRAHAELLAGALLSGRQIMEPAVFAESPERRLAKTLSVRMIAERYGPKPQICVRHERVKLNWKKPVFDAEGDFIGLVPR